MKKSGIIITFILSLLVIPMYIYTYKQGISVFWLIFILDRIMTPIIESKFGDSLDAVNVDIKDNKEGIVVSKFIIRLILLCIIGIGMIIYVLFKYPQLFIVLAIGEVIDKVISVIIKKISNRI